MNSTHTCEICYYLSTFIVLKMLKKKINLNKKIVAYPLDKNPHCCTNFNLIKRIIKQTAR